MMIETAPFARIWVLMEVALHIRAATEGGRSTIGLRPKRWTERNTAESEYGRCAP